MARELAHDREAQDQPEVSSSEGAETSLSTVPAQPDEPTPTHPSSKIDPIS